MTPENETPNEETDEIDTDYMSVFYIVEEEDERDEYRLDRSQHN